MAAPAQSAQITPFPLGVSSWGMPLVGSGPFITVGRVFFVDSTAGGKGNDTAHGTNPLTPFATVAYAIGACTQNQGDLIFVLPGHTESIIGAAGINCNVAGVTIIGVPLSGGRDRPIFTFSTLTAASLDVNAANVRITNCVFDLTGIDALTAGFNVKAANFTLDGCEVIFATAAGQAVRTILTDANADRMRVLNNFFSGTADAGASRVIDLAGTGSIPDIQISGNRIVGDVAVAVNVVSGAVCTNLLVRNNVIVTLGTTQECIYVNDASSNGVIADNYLVGTTMAALLNSMGCLAANNYGFNALGTVPPQLVPPGGTQLSASTHSLVDQILSAYMGIKRENYFKVSVDFTSASWNTVATHRVIVVVGCLRLRILPVCTADLTGTGSISFGVTSDTSAFIAATTATAIDLNELWLDSTTPSQVVLLSGKGTTPGKMIDAIVRAQAASNDIGFQITTGALTGGSIDFHVWWEALTSETDAPTIGTGQVMA